MFDMGLLNCLLCIFVICYMFLCKNKIVIYINKYIDVQYIHGLKTKTILTHKTHLTPKNIIMDNKI